MKSIRINCMGSSRVTNKESSKESRTRNRIWCNCSSSRGINWGSSWRSCKDQQRQQQEEYKMEYLSKYKGKFQSRRLIEDGRKTWESSRSSCRQFQVEQNGEKQKKKEAGEEVGGTADVPARGVPKYLARVVLCRVTGIAAAGVAGRLASKEAGEVEEEVA